MSKMKSLSVGLSCAAIFAASPALAQITAEELWAEWQEYGSVMGQSLTAEQVTETADGLTLSGLRTDIAQDGVSTSATLDQVILTENADGSVSITLSERYRLEVTSDPGLGEPVDMTMDMTHAGLDIRVTGDAGNRRYDYSADRLDISSVEIGADQGQAAPVTFNVAITDLVANYAFDGAVDESVSFTSDSTFGGMTGLIDAAAPDGQGGSFKLNFSLDGGTSSSSGSISALAALAQAGGGLPEEFDMTGDMTYDRLSYEMAVQEPGESVNIAFANGGGAVDIAFGQGGLAYDFSGREIDARVQVSSFPLPVEVSADSAAFLIQVPMAPQAELSDMALRLDYQGLEIGDALWGMFDPGAAIPRDPANLLVDITGKVRMFANLMAGDPAAFQGPPGELREVTLNALNVSVAGASLEGEGDLDFAEGQIIPQPVGAIDLRMAGLNGLLDRLTGAGLLPEQQAAMARGVAGMFARPGATMDTLETTIDFLPGGQITANGIPLQ